MDEIVDNLEVQEQSTTTETPEKDNSQDDAVAQRHAQQLEGSRKEVERYRAIAAERIHEAGTTVDNLVELNKTDPKLAEAVAQKFGFENLNALKKHYTNQSGQQGLTEDDIEKIVSEREAKKEHERSLKKASKIIDELPKGLKDLAQARFDKITNGKTLTEEDAIEFAEMATLYVQKDKINEARGNEALAQAASTGAGNSKKADSTEDKWVRRNGQWVNLSTSTK